MEQKARSWFRHEKHHLAVGLLVIGIFCVILAGILSFQSIQRFRRYPMPYPKQTDISLIQDWMTIPYIAHSYAVPEEVFVKRLGLSTAIQRKPLRQIAKEQNKPSDELIKQIQIIITDFHRQHTPPNP